MDQALYESAHTYLFCIAHLIVIRRSHRVSFPVAKDKQAKQNIKKGKRKEKKPKKSKVRKEVYHVTSCRRRRRPFPAATVANRLGHVSRRTGVSRQPSSDPRNPPCATFPTQQPTRRKLHLPFSPFRTPNTGVAVYVSGRIRPYPYVSVHICAYISPYLSISGHFGEPFPPTGAHAVPANAKAWPGHSKNSRRKQRGA